MTTVYSTSRVDAMQRLSTLTKSLSRIFTMQSRRNALLRERYTLTQDGKIDFDDKSVTENTRVSYPIDHIKNIVSPVSSAPAAKNVIFLISRCIWSTSSSIYPDTRADTVLLPVWIYSKACWYRAWNHRANTYILSLLRTGIP